MGVSRGRANECDVRMWCEMCMAYVRIIRFLFIILLCARARVQRTMRILTPILGLVVLCLLCTGWRHHSAPQHTRTHPTTKMTDAKQWIWYNSFSRACTRSCSLSFYTFSSAQWASNETRAFFHTKMIHPFNCMQNGCRIDNKFTGTLLTERKWWCSRFPAVAQEALIWNVS